MIEKKQNHILILHTKPQWKMPGYTKNSYFWTKNHVLVPPPSPGRRMRAGVYISFGLMNTILNQSYKNQMYAHFLILFSFALVVSQIATNQQD